MKTMIHLGVMWAFILSSVPALANQMTITGTVASISPPSLSLKESNGAVTAVMVSPSTKITLKGKNMAVSSTGVLKAVLGKIKAGDSCQATLAMGRTTSLVCQ